MAFMARTTEIHIHKRSKPNFAVVTENHRDAAWVVPVDSDDLSGYFTVAEDAHARGNQLSFQYEEFREWEERDGTKIRHYWRVSGLAQVLPR